MRYFTERYFVDERGGCVAVRDRDNSDFEYHGLQSDTKGVIAYWDGTRKQNTCPMCNHVSTGYWMVHRRDKIQARNLCNKLNKEDIE